MKIITTHSLFDGRAVFFHCHTIISPRDLFEVVQKEEIRSDIHYFHCVCVCYSAAVDGSTRTLVISIATLQHNVLSKVSNADFEAQEGV